MGYFFLAVLRGVACLLWFWRKASKLDFIHYPDRDIDMCRFCQHEYPSWQIENERRLLEAGAPMGMTMSDDNWDRFCCDALRHRLKARYQARHGCHSTSE